MDVTAYLERIDYHGPLKPTLETLRGLHRAHMMTAPFENLDIHLGRRIVLDEERLFDKIVRRKRGVFCYDFAGKLHWQRDLGRMETRYGWGEGNAPVINGDTRLPISPELAASRDERVLQIIPAPAK